MDYKSVPVTISGHLQEKYFSNLKLMFENACAKFHLSIYSKWCQKRPLIDNMASTIASIKPIGTDQ